MRIKSVFWIVAPLFFGQCVPADSIIVNEEEGFKNINGSEVYYKTMGEGAPMVVVHGGPILGHSYFLPHFEELTKEHQLIFYDQRACGQSSADIDTTTMSIDGFVDDIEQLRQDLKLNKINLLGHSWGGLIVMKYALKYPGKINHLILSNSVPASTDEWQKENLQLSLKVTKEDSIAKANILSSDEIKSDETSVIEKLMRLSYKSQFHNKNLLDSLHIFIPNDFMNRSSQFTYLSKDLAFFDLYQELSATEISTLIIYGDAEPAATTSGNRLANTIPNSELVVIKNSGHFPFIEQPKEYFNTINSFLLQ